MPAYANNFTTKSKPGANDFFAPRDCVRRSIADTIRTLFANNFDTVFARRTRMRHYARCSAALCVLVVCVAGARFAAASQGSQTMTNADVVRMVSIGLSEDVIVAAIRTAPVARFDTGADDLVALRNQRVSNAVIAAMRDRQASPTVGSQGRVAGGAFPKGKWEVEVHGGGAFGSNPTDGTGSLPPAGSTFVTSSLNSSRRASSWYFGDGAMLMNAINASFAGLLGAPGRITPLDPVL